MPKKTPPKEISIYDLFAYQRRMRKRQARREWWGQNWDKVLMAVLALLAVVVPLIIAA